MMFRRSSFEFDDVHFEVMRFSRSEAQLTGRGPKVEEELLQNW